MTGFQKSLALVVVLELVAAAWEFRARARATTLPQINWNLSLIEPEAVREIRDAEGHFRADLPEKWLEMARLYRTFGLFPEAEYCYRHLDTMAPHDTSYLYYWAECFDLMGQTQEATKLYHRVLETPSCQPNGPQTAQYCWLNIGQDRLREENVPAALEALRQAPDLPKAKVLMARVLVRSGHAQEATVLLDQLVRETPDVIEINEMKSWAEAELGHAAAAAHFYDLSLRTKKPLFRSDPIYQEVLRRRNAMGSLAWHFKSVQLESAGQLAEASEWSRKSLAADWTEEKAFQLAKLEWEQGRPQQAIDLMEQCHQRVGASARGLDLIGVAWVKLGDNKKARQAWQQAAQLEDTANLHSKLAELSRLEGDAPGARRELALEQFMNGKDAYLTNNLAAAREHLVASVRMVNDHAPAWFYLGETCRALDETRGADVAYRRCLELNPDHGRARRGLARLTDPAANP